MKWITTSSIPDKSIAPICNDNEEIFLGRSLINRKSSFSELTGKSIDCEVRNIANKAMSDALKILNSKRKEMDTIVEVLIEEEVIDKK